MRLALILVCSVISAIQATVIGTRDNNIVERHDYTQLIDQAQFVKLVAQYLPHLLDRETQALTPTNQHKAFEAFGFDTMNPVKNEGISNNILSKNPLSDTR